MWPVFCTCPKLTWFGTSWPRLKQTDLFWKRINLRIKMTCNIYKQYKIILIIIIINSLWSTIFLICFLPTKIHYYLSFKWLATRERLQHWSEENGLREEQGQADIFKSSMLYVLVISTHQQEGNRNIEAYLNTLMVLADGGSPEVSTSISAKYSSYISIALFCLMQCSIV